MAQLNATDRKYRSAYSALIGVAGLVILLQGLWAGIFLQHDGERDSAANWIDIHARGADLSIILVILAAVIAFMAFRNRRELWMGAAGLAVLLVAESYIGGLIRDNGKDSLTAIHVPLAMAIMGLVVWLSRSGRSFEG